MDQTERDAMLTRLAAERHQTVEELLADFSQMVMQAELAYQEVEAAEAEYDWLEDAGWDE